MTAEQRRQLVRAAVELANYAASLNDSYPFPPDRHHRQLEEMALGVLELSERTTKVIRRKRDSD